MLSGEPPFSRSTGQVASQHLCKPLPTEVLANAPDCVVKLIQLMTQTDNKRPQTPRDLEKQITACLESLRAPADNTVSKAGDRHKSTQTGYPSSHSEGGTVFLDNYYRDWLRNSTNFLKADGSSQRIFVRNIE
jgi:hypothetical protein